jgi:hypothetical protein
MISGACNEFLNCMGTPTIISPSNINELAQKHVAMLFMLGGLEGMEIQLWAPLDEENK